MALSKATIEKMAEKLGMLDEVRAALTAETEAEVAIPEVEVFSKPQLTARDNIKYNEGKEAGEEMSVKAVKEANNLSFQGKKVESLYKHLKDTLAAPADESETVKKLRDNLTKAEQEREQYKTQMSTIKKTTAIHALIPELSNGMSKSEAMAVMEANGFDFREENGAFKVYRNGEAVKDPKMLEAIPAGDVVKSFFTEEKKWVGTAAPAADTTRVGRGGGNQTARTTAGVPSSVKEIEEAWTAENPNSSLNGAEYAAYFEAQMKAAKEAGAEIN